MTTQPNSSAPADLSGPPLSPGKPSGDIAMERLQRTDKALGVLFCLALQPLRWWRGARRLLTARRVERQPQRILLIKFWGIGSMQLLTPSVQHLRQQHPGAHLSLLTLKANRAAAEGFGVFDSTITLDVTGCSWPRLFARIAALVFTLRKRRFEAVYDFEFFTRFSALVSALSGARQSHGFGATSVWRGGFHTRRVPFNRYWHVAKNFLVLAGKDAPTVGPENLTPLTPTDSDRYAAKQALQAGGLNTALPYVVLNPNAGSLSLERRWPRENYAELARQLAEQEHVQVVLIGSADEREWTEGVAILANEKKPGIALANLAGAVNLSELLALCDQAQGFVSNDSGPMHLVAARGVPTLGLFGPETPVMYAPIGLHTKALYDPPPCSPCINVHDNKVANCIFGRPECLVNLDVQRVLQSLHSLIQDGSSSPSSNGSTGQATRVQN